MMTRHVIPTLALAAGLVLPAARLVAQQPQHPDTARHPQNVKQAASNVANETKRVYKRSEKAVRKGAKDTEKQAKRTGKHIARTVSPEERARQDSAKAARRKP